MNESFGEAMLLALVMLHFERSADYDGSCDGAFYDLLDSQTDAECAYHCTCSDMLDLREGRSYASPYAASRLAGWHQTTGRVIKRLS